MLACTFIVDEVYCSRNASSHDHLLTEAMYRYVHSCTHSSLCESKELPTSRILCRSHWWQSLLMSNVCVLGVRSCTFFYDCCWYSLIIMFSHSLWLFVFYRCWWTSYPSSTCSSFFSSPIDVCVYFLRSLNTGGGILRGIVKHRNEEHGSACHILAWVGSLLFWTSVHSLIQYAFCFPKFFAHGDLAPLYSFVTTWSARSHFVGCPCCCVSFHCLSFFWWQLEWDGYADNTTAS